MKKRVLSVLVREALRELTVSDDSMTTQRPVQKKRPYRKTVIVAPSDRTTGRLLDMLAAQAMQENETLRSITERLKERFQDAVVHEAVDQFYSDVTVSSVAPQAPTPPRTDDPAWIEAAQEVVSTLYVYGIISAQTEAVEEVLAYLGASFRAVVYESMASLVGIVQPTKADQKAILEQVIAAGHTVLPVREGGMAMHSEREVVQMMATHATLLQRAFDYLHNEAEWIVQVHCDREALQREMDESDTRFESMIDSMIMTLRGRTASIARFHANTWAEAAIEVVDSPSTDLVENIIQNCRKYSHQVLGAIADDSVVNPSEEDAMLLHVAYLVPKDREDAFREALTILQNRYDNLGFSYQYMGPSIPNLFAFRNRPRF